MVPVMLKSKLLSLLLASSALVFAGCVSEPDDEVGSDELAAIESEIENLDPVPLCPDLNDVYFEVPQSCTRDGQLGIKICHQTCDFDRVLAFTPTGTTCKIVSKTCTPWQCGPCEVVEIEGPLP
jgi:hypothetical protein